MFTEAQFQQSVDDAIAEIQSAGRDLSNVACPSIRSVCIHLSELSAEKIEELIENVQSGYAKADKEKDFIYIIELAGSRDDDMTELRAMFEAEKHGADDYSRLNPGGHFERTLYVGRSKTLRKRLREHLGLGNKGIYALHLQRWATIHEAKIEISFMEFDRMANLLVQSIEDGMWSMLRPAFERKGER